MAMPKVRVNARSGDGEKSQHFVSNSLSGLQPATGRRIPRLQDCSPALGQAEILHLPHSSLSISLSMVHFVHSRNKRRDPLRLILGTTHSFLVDEEVGPSDTPFRTEAGIPNTQFPLFFFHWSTHLLLTLVFCSFV